MDIKVPFNDLRKQYLDLKNEIDFVIKDIIDRSLFIRGPYVEKFEKIFAKEIGVDYCVSVANGTDALELSIKSLNPPNNSEIITTSNTFVSTVNSIINVGCKPVFADIDTNYNIDPNKIENHINKKTFAIMPVHLNGLPACMNKIRKISKKWQASANKIWKQIEKNTSNIH